MVDRVLLSASTIKVSKAGVDVSTAIEEDLVLNGDTQSVGLLMTGYALLPAWTGTSAPQIVEIMFPDVLPFIPWVRCTYSSPYASGYIWHGAGHVGTLVGGSTGAYTGVSIRAMYDRVVIAQEGFAGGYPTTTRTVRYFVYYPKVGA